MRRNYLEYLLWAHGPHIRYYLSDKNTYHLISAKKTRKVLIFINYVERISTSVLSRVTGWRGKLLSTEAKKILIQTCLSSIPIYMISFFNFPKCSLALINTQLTNCMWSDEEGHRKNHLANWPCICTKKNFEGLGVPNLQDLNVCLLSSWIKRYYVIREGSLRRKFIDARCNTKNPNTLFCHDPHPSIFWKGVMRTEHLYLKKKYPQDHSTLTL